MNRNLKPNAASIAAYCNASIAHVERALDIVEHADCIGRDVTGNPLYYIPSPCLDGITPKQSRAYGVKTYNGKLHGDGYTVGAYALTGLMIRLVEAMEA